MALKFINSKNINLQTPGLLVCAGTVTCKTVESMGAGFSLFKQTFQEINWQPCLQKNLDEYFKSKTPIPVFECICVQDGLYGAVATVSCFNSNSVIDNSNLFDIEKEKTNYKNAVKQAIQYAEKAKIPLYIQPLGIGVYGWPFEIAANLFAEAIKEENASIDLNILIYAQEPGSNDQLFKEKLAVICLKKSAVSDTILDAGIKTSLFSQSSNSINSSHENLFSNPAFQAILVFLLIISIIMLMAGINGLAAPALAVASSTAILGLILGGITGVTLTGGALAYSLSANG